MVSLLGEKTILTRVYIAFWSCWPHIVCCRDRVFTPFEKKKNSWSCGSLYLFFYSMVSHPYVWFLHLARRWLRVLSGPEPGSTFLFEKTDSYNWYCGICTYLRQLSRKKKRNIGCNNICTNRDINDHMRVILHLSTCLYNWGTDYVDNPSQMGIFNTSGIRDWKDYNNKSYILKRSIKIATW